MKFSKKCVIAMFLSIHIFTMLMVVAFFVKGDVPEALIVPFFAFWGAEGTAMAWIKNCKTKKKNSESKEKKK
ncbi:MAG: hypothetical protein IJA02_08970 [Clostridia bacterium]|nr:hypothetical protein [Clostridia bacterium]